MATIREKRDKKLHKCFVGRARELNKLTEFIYESEPDYNILSVWGVGGVGKSTLLRKIIRDIQQNDDLILPFCALETIKSPIDIMLTWRYAFLKDQFVDFDNELKKIKQIESKIQTATNSITNGTFKALEAAGPIGAFAIGTLGEERIRSFVGNVITKPELESYLTAQSILTKRFSEEVSKLSSNKKIVLFLDTYEIASPNIDSWLRDLLDAELSTEVIIIIAGRDRLEDMNWEWAEWASVIREIELKNFSDEETRVYLNNWGITNEQFINGVMKFTGNLPWALEMTIESLGDSIEDELFQETFELRRIEHKVVSRFMRQISDNKRLQKIVEVCSVLSFFNKNILEFILDEDIADQLDKLRDYSFVRIRTDGQLSLHDVVRDFLSSELETLSPQDWKEYHRKAANYFSRENQNEVLYGERWLSNTVELIRHISFVNQQEMVGLINKYCGNLVGPMLYIYGGPIINVLQDQLNKNRITEENALLTAHYYFGKMYLAQGKFQLARESFFIVIKSSDAESNMKLSSYAALCDLLHRKGEVSKALEVSILGLEYAKKVSDINSISLMAVRTGEMFGVQGNFLKSDEYCRESEQYLGGIEDLFISGQIYLLLAHVYLWRGDCDNGERCLLNALEKWSVIDNKFGIAQAKSSLGWLCALDGRCEKGLGNCNEALLFFVNNEDSYHTGLVALNIAKFYRLRRKFTEANYWNEYAIRELKKVGSFLYECIATFQLGQVYFESGKYKKAIDSLERSLELGIDQVGDKYSVGVAQLYLGLSFRMTGLEDKAIEFLNNSQITLSESQNPYGLALLYLYLAKDFLSKEKLDKFAENIGKAYKIAENRNHVDIISKAMLLCGHQKVLEYLESEKIEIVKNIVSNYELSLSYSILFNRYLLDEITDEIITSLRKIAKEQKQVCRDIINSIIEYWQNYDSKFNKKFELVELENREIEKGDGELQISVIEKLQSIL